MTPFSSVSGQANGGAGAFARVQTRFGWVHLAAFDGAIVQSSVPDEPRERFLAELGERFPGVAFADDPADPLLRKACSQVLEYSQGRRRDFDVPLDPRGTPFQRNVWGALARIPYGQVQSYRDVAERVGKPGAFRAVGQANHRNPIPILIPCHRVVAADGGLGGYGGGLRMKQELLGHEGVRI